MEIPLPNYPSNRHPPDPSEDPPHPDPEPNDEKNERSSFGLEVIDPGPFRSSESETRKWSVASRRGSLSSILDPKRETHGDS